MEKPNEAFVEDNDLEHAETFPGLDEKSTLELTTQEEEFLNKASPVEAFNGLEKSTFQLATEKIDPEDGSYSDLREKNKSQKRLAWYYAPVYLLFWVGLFFAVVHPLFNHLPTGVKLEEESDLPNTFIAQRAESLLLKLDLMGPKIAGDYVTEVLMVELLLEEIEKVRQSMRSDLYDLEVDVQRSSGAFLHWQMINMYQGIQNVVVKLSCKSSNSSSYLLVNSHYDSKPSSVG